jgi:hypothetical protein
VDIIELSKSYPDMNISTEYQYVIKMNVVNAFVGILPPGNERDQLEARAKAGAIRKLKNILDGNDPDESLHFCIERNGEIKTEIIIPAISRLVILVA